MIKVGVMGASFNEPNKGCEALAYSTFFLLDQLAGELSITMEVILIRRMPMGRFIKCGFSDKDFYKEYLPQMNFSNIVVRILFLFHSKAIDFYRKEMSCMDFIIDYTGGDSFSDIYGLRRFITAAVLKKYIIKHNVKLIMGSETIGPFTNKCARNIASEILKKSYRVYVRDIISYNYVKEKTGVEPIITTDVAFLLPYKKNPSKENEKNTRIGINVSGLLWQDALSQKSRYNLKLNYIEYIDSLLEELLKREFEVWIVVHAFDEELKNPDDNDCIPLEYLKKKYPGIKISPMFSTCMDAKSFISGLDLLIASRMHATIAAFSSNVPVIPVSYSRKFEGVYYSLEYKYTIDCREESLKNAILKTMCYVDKRKEIKTELTRCNLIAIDKIKTMKDDLKDIIEAEIGKSE
ncbi:polysaccharide pyruvyl transferase family protein [Butyrivibrio fibrisolvens]|uniref:polysaccharide pyruvyl transferase family protein n=1 Tax=Butyrivibrio fibrisolvens TaxID=831 RepID=UPI000423F839|nr:polysaccharide pyruvyl transferase family protein [Butyrivibrio fibrisolvens]